MPLKCPACHGSNTKRAGMGVGAAILVVGALALFGGGKAFQGVQASSDSDNGEPAIATAEG